MSPAAPGARGGTEAVVAGEGVVSVPLRPAGSPGPPGAGCREALVLTPLPQGPRPPAGPASREERGCGYGSVTAPNSSTLKFWYGWIGVPLFKTADDNDPNLVFPRDAFI